MHRPCYPSFPLPLPSQGFSCNSRFQIFHSRLPYLHLYLQSKMLMGYVKTAKWYVCKKPISIIIYPIVLLLYSPSSFLHSPLLLFYFLVGTELTLKSFRAAPWGGGVIFFQRRLRNCMRAFKCVCTFVSKVLSPFIIFHVKCRKFPKNSVGASHQMLFLRFCVEEV